MACVEIVWLSQGKLYWGLFFFANSMLFSLGKGFLGQSWVSYRERVLVLYFVYRKHCWQVCYTTPWARRLLPDVAVGGLTFGVCVPSIFCGCFCLWLGLSASYSASKEPLCLFSEPSLSATAGSWESATSLFWGITSSQHGQPQPGWGGGTSPRTELRQF